MEKLQSFQESYNRISMGERAKRPADMLVAATDAFCLKERPSSSEIKQYHELFCSLIGKCEPAVKRLLAPSLARNAYAPRVALIYMCLDSAAAAAPVLAYSKVIDPKDIDQIIDKTTVQHHRVIAGRPNLSASNITKLIGREDLTIMRRLLANDAIELTKAQRTYMESIVRSSIKSDITLPKYDAKPIQTPIEELLQLAGKGGRIERKATEIPKAIVAPAIRPMRVSAVAKPIVVPKPVVVAVSKQQKPLKAQQAIKVRKKTIPQPKIVARPAAEAQKATVSKTPITVEQTQRTAKIDTANEPAVIVNAHDRDARFHLEFMTAAKAKSRGAQMKAIRTRFELHDNVVQRIFEDASGDTLLIVLKASKMEAALAHQAVILSMPMVGLSVQNAARSVHIYAGLKLETCKLAVNNWQVSENIRRAAEAVKSKQASAEVEEKVLKADESEAIRITTPAAADTVPADVQEIAASSPALQADDLEVAVSISEQVETPQVPEVAARKPAATYQPQMYDDEMGRTATRRIELRPGTQGSSVSNDMRAKFLKLRDAV